MKRIFSHTLVLVIGVFLWIGSGAAYAQSSTFVQNWTWGGLSPPTWSLTLNLEQPLLPPVPRLPSRADAWPDLLAPPARLSFFTSVTRDPYLWSDLTRTGARSSKADLTYIARPFSVCDEHRILWRVQIE